MVWKAVHDIIELEGSPKEQTIVARVDVYFKICWMKMCHKYIMEINKIFDYEQNAIPLLGIFEWFTYFCPVHRINSDFLTLTYISHDLLTIISYDLWPTSLVTFDLYLSWPLTAISRNLWAVSHMTFDLYFTWPLSCISHDLWSIFHVMTFELYIQKFNIFYSCRTQMLW